MKPAAKKLTGFPSGTRKATSAMNDRFISWVGLISDELVDKGPVAFTRC
jgi:hypothetical protein